MALHLPPKRPSDLQLFVAHLELALESRFELCDDKQATPCDVAKMVLDSVAEARRELGW